MVETEVLESKKHLSPFYALIIVAFSIFMAEILVMFFISLLPPLAAVLEAFIYSMLLVLLLSPILYFFLFRPLILHISGRRQAEDDLAKSEARAKGIVDIATDGIITIDRHGIIKSFNFAAEKIFGYNAHEVIDKNVNILMPSP